MTLVEVLIAGLIGLAAGTLGGLAGIGGSIVMLPGLAILLGFKDESHSTQHLYMASAMAVNVLVSAPAAWRHKKANALRPDLIRILLPVMAFTIILGVLFSNRIDGTYLRQILALFIAAYCIMNILRATGTLKRRDDAQELNKVHRLAAVGSVTGFVAGLLGIGGGILMVPMLQVLCRIRLKAAVATSSAVMCLTATIGATIKIATLNQHGFAPIDALWIILAMGPTAILGGTIGANLVHILPLNTMRLIVSILLLLAAVKLSGLI